MKTIKERAKALIGEYPLKACSPTEFGKRVDELETFVKELANAPEPEPVARAVVTETWREIGFIGDPDSLPKNVDVYLYSASPAVTITAEQALRDALERMDCSKAQSLTAGDLLAIVGEIDYEPAPPADLVRDAERYRWLRNPDTDAALVLDKKVGWREYDEGTRTGGYAIYEYRCGDDLDEKVDAAIERDKLKGQS